MAFIFLPECSGAAFDNEADRAASSTDGDRGRLANLNYSGQTAQTRCKFVIEAHRGHAVVGRRLLARINGIRQVHIESQHVMHVETWVLPQKYMQNLEQESGADKQH